MAALPLTQICYLILALTGGIVIGSERALAACEVYPSEYAYHKDSVNRAEPASANCRNYPSGLTMVTQPGSEDYIHCDGTQLRLTDSDLGPEQYSSSYYYEWSAGTVPRQLLFIFPTRVNLTTITLHYYSDSQRSLPRLRFYAAPDDFDVWDASPGNSRSVDIAAVPPGEGSAGRRNVSVSFNFSTTKILMIKLSSTYKLAVSEVDFFICSDIIQAIAMTTEPNPPTTTKTSPPMTTEATVASSMSTTSQALAASEVYPSEYAYHKDSVNRAETPSANCRNYPSGLVMNTQPGSEFYIHCDGTQLRLTDSDLGPEQYISSYYYEWRAGSGISQLLFIFPTRVNLTTITLHYYSDSQRGLPRLRFYAAPDDFDIWDAPPGNSRYVDIAAVPPGAESAGRRNVSVNVNFSTTKLLMVKSGSNFKLAVSEVDFFIYNNIVAMTTEPDPPTTTKASPPMTTEATVASSMSTTSQELDTESDLSSTSSATSVYSQVALTSILVTMATLLLHGPARPGSS